MTAEQKREQQLKRFLPALAITVIYFVFVSGFLSEKRVQAEKDYQALSASGNSQNAMPNAMREQADAQQKLAELNKKKTDFQQRLSSAIGFLSGEAATNNVAAEISKLLVAYNMKLQQETHEQLEEKDLNLSLAEVWQLLKPADNKDKAQAAKAQTAAKDDKTQANGKVLVHHLWLKGGYSNMYQALEAIANSELQVLPVSLTMKMPEDDSENGDLDWELILWL